MHAYPCLMPLRRKFPMLFKANICCALVLLRKTISSSSLPTRGFFLCAARDKSCAYCLRSLREYFIYVVNFKTSRSTCLLKSKIWKACMRFAHDYHPKGDHGHPKGDNLVLRTSMQALCACMLLFAWCLMPLLTKTTFENKKSVKEQLA